MRAWRWVGLLVLAAFGGCGGEVTTADAGMDARPPPPPDAPPTPDSGRTCERPADCDDGVYCNGEENCIDAVCVPGTPPCDAETQRCDEATLRCETLDCTGESADQDGDGHRSIACDGDDCNDEDGSINPSRSETCIPGDGITDSTDEDCNPTTFGFVDIDSDGAADARCHNVDARSGMRFGGTDCDDNNRVINPLSREICDARFDENCNGEVDEGCLCSPEGTTRPCEGARGVCATGTETCSAAGWTACSIAPSTELCNGSGDEDCDGAVDEGCSCVSGTTRPCGLGACAGMQTCTGGMWGTCSGRSPTTETCDGMDTNCNGIGDADDPAVVGVGASCGSSVGTCRPGTQTCSGSMLVCGGTGYVPSTAEACDHLDNDCNGSIDNGVSIAAECNRTHGTFDCFGSATCTQLSSRVNGNQTPRAAYAQGWSGDFGRASYYRASFRMSDTNPADSQPPSGVVALLLTPSTAVGPDSSCSDLSLSCLTDSLPLLAAGEEGFAVAFVESVGVLMLHGTSAGWVMPATTTLELLPAACFNPPDTGADYTLELIHTGSSFTGRVTRVGCGSATATYTSSTTWNSLYGARGSYPRYRVGISGDADAQMFIERGSIYMERRIRTGDRNNCIGC